jgi:cell wall-associated NlpC family hydrolase
MCGVPRRHFAPRFAAAIAFTLTAVLIVTGAALARSSKSGHETSSTTLGYVLKRLTGPSRTLVYSATGSWLATFTDGARTVDVSGPQRTFAESTTTMTVSSRVWVRLLPNSFDGTVDTSWLAGALADTSNDVLAVAMQYVTGAAPVYDSSGRQVAADADYGPIGSDGTRQPGADFNDYLGVAWTYPNGSIDQPEADEFNSLDCSGFMRMVWGYRSGFPLALSPDGHGLPRRSYEMADGAPGVVVLPNLGVVPASRSALQPGDLVFFDASTDDGTRIDHVGMYLGKDSAGHDRFISSRRTVNGPTMGDVGGRSILDGTGLYALSLREARRL